MKYFRIKDDCGWVHYCTSIHDDMTPDLFVLLTPYTRQAEEITREEYEAAVVHDEKRKDEQHTVDVKPVRHGRWIVDTYLGADVMSGGRCVICSECGKGITYGAQNYCPKCGAKMDGGAVNA